MALRRRGAKPDPEEEEEDLEEGAEEEAEEEEGEEGLEDAADDEEEGGEEEEEEEEEEDEEEEDAEEAVSSRSRRGPAARGTIEDKPVMDGYSWMTIVTCCLFIIAIVVQVREHSEFWRMGQTMKTDPVRHTTHFNAVSEGKAGASLVNKPSERVDPTKDTFGTDTMEYQEVTDLDVADYAVLYDRVLGTGRGSRPLPSFKNTPPTPDSGQIKRLVPLSGLSALKWVQENKEMATSESMPLGGGAPTVPPGDGGAAPLDGGAGTVVPPVNPTTPGNPVVPPTPPAPPM